MILQRNIKVFLDSPWIPLFISLFFLVLILLNFIQLFSGVPPPKIIRKPAIIVQEKKDASLMLNNPVFGVYVPPDLNSSKIKQSMLQLTIVGILYSTSESHSQVIIESSEGEKIFKVGDSLFGEGTIKKIIPNGVIIERNGVLERLNLPEDELKFESSSKVFKE